MNADELVVFDTATRKVVANLDGFPRFHLVPAAPEIDRVFASVTGEHSLLADKPGIHRGSTRRAQKSQFMFGAVTRDSAAIPNGTRKHQHTVSAPGQEDQ
jgi:hypothetical protein